MRLLFLHYYSLCVITWVLRWFFSLNLFNLPSVIAVLQSHLCFTALTWVFGCLIWRFLSILCSFPGIPDGMRFCLSDQFFCASSATSCHWKKSASLANQISISPSERIVYEVIFLFVLHQLFQLFFFNFYYFFLLFIIGR